MPFFAVLLLYRNCSKLENTYLLLVVLIVLGSSFNGIVCLHFMMFKNEYQGGLSFEVFGANGADPLGKIKNHHVKRKYDKEVKGYIFALEGSTTTARLQFPLGDSKQSLGLIQRFLVMQVYIPLSNDFAVGLTTTDINNSKRRIVVSTSFKDVSSTPLHAKLPLTIVKRDVWLNLCLDLVSLTSELFLSQTFKALEAFAISGTCKVRRVFTMRTQPHDMDNPSDDFPTQQCESIPANLQYSNNVRFTTQVISMMKIRKNLESKDTQHSVRDPSGYWSSNEDLYSARRMSEKESAQTQQTHIAFGTKVSYDISSGRRHAPSSARAENGHLHKSSDIYSNPPSARKVHSSKARLQHHDLTKGSASSVLKKKAIVPKINTKPTSDHVDRLVRSTKEKDVKTSHNLLNLIDDLDLSDAVRSAAHKKLKKPKEIEGGNDLDEQSPVFKFSSHPHTVPRDPTPSDDTHSENDAGSFSDSGYDYKESLQQKIVRSTPTPRSNSANNNNNRILKPSKDFPKPKASRDYPFKPQSSLSPDISIMHGPSSQLYDSARYTDESQKLSQSPPLNRSVVSLKSSDATLTASVDTLVHSSILEAKNNAEDSLDDSNEASSHSINFSPYNGSQKSVTLNRKSIRELPTKADVGGMPESTGFQVGTWSETFEAQMLESMKRGVDEDWKNQEEEDDEDHEKNVDFRAKFEDSFDNSWSTYKNPPPMQPQAYDYEMRLNCPSGGNTLDDYTMASHSNPRDWANLLSPPTVLPSERAQQKKESISDAESVNNDCDVMGLSDGSSSMSIKSSTTTGDTDEEEMLDLLYDPCLNCYFDPKSGKYYELKN